MTILSSLQTHGLHSASRGRNEDVYESAMRHILHTATHTSTLSMTDNKHVLAWRMQLSGLDMSSFHHQASSSSNLLHPEVALTLEMSHHTALCRGALQLFNCPHTYCFNTKSILRLRIIIVFIITIVIFVFFTRVILNPVPP